MGRKRAVAGARCVKHPDAHVVAQRTYDTGSGRRRQYRCTPAVGEQHWFSVIITDGSAPAASWAPPPVCAVHPASRVIRFGTYGKTTGKPRQRYRCFPEDGSTVHTFTPPLPREHVHEGHEQCDHCDELRGVHHGETSVARTHATPTSPTPTPDSSPRRAVWRATSVRSTSATKRLASRTVRPIPDGRAYGRDATSSPADGNGWWCARRGSSTRTATRSPPVGTTRPSHAGPGRCGSSMPAPLPVRTPNKRPLDLPAAAGSGAATTPGWLPAAGSPSRALSTGQ
jgi:hypothetical protein